MESSTPQRPGPGARRRIAARPRPRWVRLALGPTSASPRLRRTALVARFSLPATLVFAGVKLALGVSTLSVLLIGNGLFALAIVVAKALALRALRDRTPRAHARAHATAAHRMGLVIAGAALLYVASAVPGVLGVAHAERYDPVVAVLIAAVAFVELGFAVPGALLARRTGELLLGALKRTNLAAALVLLALAQTALLSFTQTQRVDVANGVAGLLFGGIALVVGGRLAWSAHTAIRTATADAVAR